MSVLLTCLIADKASSLATWAGLYQFHRNEQQRIALGRWDKTGRKRMPLIGG
jgi:hypothetical protein